jgi:hypothetical protein
MMHLLGWWGNKTLTSQEEPGGARMSQDENGELSAGVAEACKKCHIKNKAK